MGKLQVRGRPYGIAFLIHRFRRNLRDYGLPVTLRKTAAYLLQPVYFHQVFRVYKINLGRTNPRTVPDLEHFTFRFLTPSDLDAFAQIEEVAEWLRDNLKRRIVEGQLCLVAMDGETVAGFNLISFECADMQLVNVKKKLRDRTAWSEQISVSNEYRKAGLGSELRYRVFEDLSKSGFRTLYGGTLRSNEVSLRLARSVGFTEIADVHYTKFLFFKNWRFERVRR